MLFFCKFPKKTLAFPKRMCYDIRAIEILRAIMPFYLMRKR